MHYKSPTRPAQAEIRTPQEARRGPVPLDPKFLPLVGGGLPRAGGWQSDPTTPEALPYAGGW